MFGFNRLVKYEKVNAKGEFEIDLTKNPEIIWVPNYLYQFFNLKK